MRIITDTAGLRVLCAELERGPYVALDTEFMRDQTYWPKLCLMQAAGPHAEAVIDPLAGEMDFAPFYKLLADKHVVKAFHAARQDIEIFFHQGGVIPEPLFDSQIAAMVCGFGDSVSYETLVRNITKDEVDKSARFTDWSRRPLTKRQLDYALADVTHLRIVYETLGKQLEKTARTSWIEEELGILRDPATYQLEPSEAWRRLKIRNPNKKMLAVLASIAAWREREAQERDVPRGRVLKDEALLEIAAHPPTNEDALDHIRAIPKGYGRSRHGKSLLAAVNEGLSNPPPELSREYRQRRAEPSPAALDLLKTLLRLRANEYDVAPRLIADSEDLTRLAAGEDANLRALHGWRAEVFGNDAKALREGRLAIALDKGEAVVIENTHEKNPTRKAAS